MGAIFSGECLGTLVLIVFGGGVVANVLLEKSKGQGAGWLTISTGWFIGVVLGVFVAQSAGSAQADINPAVSLAKYLLHFYGFSHFITAVIAQFVGAFIGAIIVWLCYWQHFKATSNEQHKLAVFSTIPAIRHYPSNLMSEIIATFILVIGVGAIFGHATLGHPVSGVGPYLVGLLVWGIGISLGGPTGYAINPARDLAPRLAYRMLNGETAQPDWQYSWIPVLGPILGALAGALLWHYMFI